MVRNGQIATLTWPWVNEMKIPNIRFVGTDVFINSGKFHIDPLKIVATMAQSQILLEVGLLDLNC